MPSTTTPAISSIAAPDAYLQSGSSPPPTTIDREVLAQRVVTAVGSIAIKLTELEDDIRLLWTEFENLPHGETILGCSTKKEFCETKLHRTPRAVRYMLDGGNAANMQQRRENISLAPPEPTAAAAVEDDPITDAVNFPNSAAPHVSQPYVPNPNFNKAGTRGYAGRDAFNSFIRSLVAIAERNPNSPFVSKMDTAFSECDSDEMAEVAVHELTRAINRLSEYRAQFQSKLSAHRGNAKPSASARQDQT
jgi:hypothetical protein